jgi:hypothetical protein
MPSILFAAKMLRGVSISLMALMGVPTQGLQMSIVHYQVSWEPKAHEGTHISHTSAFLTRTL